MFKGNIQVIRVDNKVFNKRVGWDRAAQELFTQLGFHEEHGKLRLPELNPDRAGSAVNRGRLMRAWLEVGIILLLAKSKCKLPSILRSAMRAS